VENKTWGVLPQITLTHKKGTRASDFQSNKPPPDFLQSLHYKYVSMLVLETILAEGVKFKNLRG